LFKDKDTNSLVISGLEFKDKQTSDKFTSILIQFFEEDPEFLQTLKFYDFQLQLYQLESLSKHFNKITNLKRLLFINCGISDAHLEKLEISH